MQRSMADKPLEAAPTLSRGGTASSDDDNDDDDDSASLNELDGANSADVECISLLKEIFPEESTRELQRIHQKRIRHRATPEQKTAQATIAVWKTPNDSSSSNHQLTNRRRHASVSIPYDFLRLPPDVAVRRYSDQDNRWHYQLVKDLEDCVVKLHRNHAAGTSDNLADDCDCFTKVIFRDDQVGLGMNLFEEGGIVRVHSLNDRDDRDHILDYSSPSFPGPKPSFAPGPASKAGIQPGDILIGMNGIAFCESLSPVEGILPDVVSSLRESPDPVCLHFLRSRRLSSDNEQRPASLPQIVTTQSLLDTSDFLEEAQSVELSFELGRTFHSTPILSMFAEDQNSVHPFARTLISRKLIREANAEPTSQMLRQFTERARQWEATGSFTILSQKTGESTFVPLMGLRKALCVRIVNTFLDAEETAYTMWVCDLESGREWYAPVRYFRDFQDLRAATLSLHPSISQLSFPKGVLSIFGSPMRSESLSERETKCLQLESFLRSLNGIIYKEPLHPSMAEIAIHVQSFLGCDAVLGPSGLLGLATADNDMSSCGSRKPLSQEEHVRIALKRSIQRYTYRLFLLDPLQKAVSTFVSTLRSQGPRLRDIEQLQAEGQSVLKNRAIQDLIRIQAFLDQLQEMILEGCMDDLRLIAEREDYEALHPRILVLESTARTATGSDYWGGLVREAIREQIEIEVYVPLRGIVSRWLVNGWKHDDLEVHFKIRELRKRPGAFFRRSIVNYDQLDPVAAILKRGVGQSTLPSVKLRAIVEAASEISRIYSKRQEHGSSGRDTGREIHMGADEFLPIFIYCVVQAEMERPCALSILLRTLCDPINRLGETGYYLASFEAAVTHLHELDLSEERDDAQSSFVSVPLDL